MFSTFAHVYVLTSASLAPKKAQAAEMELFSLIINQKADLSLDLVVVFHCILTSQLYLNLNVNSYFFSFPFRVKDEQLLTRLTISRPAALPQ